MAESDIQRFAGGLGPLQRKRSQEKCQDHVGNVWMASPLSPSNRHYSLNEESSLQSSCQPWRKIDVQCIVLLNVLAHVGL